MSEQEKIKRPSLKELLASGDLISPEELAAALKVARVTAYQWVRRGVIPYLKLEGVVRFDPQEIRVWLEVKKQEAEAKRRAAREQAGAAI
ncbi:MAG: helix-turn-helix domain-containing protein [Desulfobacterales bacterium]|nr:helix-turn-helix domain-containing protein [Pseudomonadota bacterium]MCG2772493.1 helix-turn-helix domain-containing protein [Desulfobacterales bacterium]